MEYPITYLYLAAFIAAGIAASTLASITAPQQAKRSIVITIALVAHWALADVLSSIATDSEQLRLVGMVFAPVWALVPFFLVHAALVYTGMLDGLRSVPLAVALVLPSVGCMVLEWSGQLHVDHLPTAVNGMFFQVVATGWQIAVSAYFAIYTFAAVAVLWWTAKKRGQVEYLRPAKAILACVVPVALIGGVTNGALNSYGVQLPYLASVLASAAACLLAFWVVRFRLFAPLAILHREAEAAWRTTELRYRVLVETSPDAICVIDPRGHFLFANARMAEMLGYANLEDFLDSGKVALDFIAGSDHAQANAAMEEVVGTDQRHTMEFKGLRKDGRPFPVEVSAGLLRGEDGVPVGYLGVVRDLTGRRQDERERQYLQAQIQHAQKLESLGVLAGGIAHDFNNLLNGVLGNASLALLDLPSDAPARQRLEKIEVAAGRAAALTRQMLAYSGKGQFVVGPLDLGALVVEMAQLLQVSISKKVVLETNFADDLPLVDADASQLQQVVMNLITNASDAIGTGAGRIQLRLKACRLDAEQVIDSVSREPIPAGDYVCLEVSDDGCGVEAADVGRIFDPFYSTKFTGRGLGLAAVAGIVHGHAGGIAVTSPTGGGTTFRVYLPPARGEADPLPSRPDTTPPSLPSWRGEGAVLLVDDEEVVREVVVPSLERAGFEVLGAANGQAGLDLFDTNRERIVAAVLDLTMPKLDGREVCRELWARRPGLPVVMISGYSADEVGDLLANGHPTTFLQKPFRPDQLIGAIGELLNG